MEVKYSEHPSVTKELVKFMKENKVREGILVTKDTFKVESLGNLKFYFIPAWLFLLVKI